MTDQVLGYSVLNQNRENVYVTRNLAKRVGECKHYIQIIKYAEGKAKRVKWDIVDVTERKNGIFYMFVKRKQTNAAKKLHYALQGCDEHSIVKTIKFHINDKLTIMSNAIYKY